MRKKHIFLGKSYDKVYWVHHAMMQRCYNPKNPQFRNYGGRGISVCDKWQTFAGFFEDMGNPAPKLTLERKNNNGNYEKENCSWATRHEQAHNRSSTNLIEIGGEKTSLSEWARRASISRGAIQKRYNKGLRGYELLQPAKIIPVSRRRRKLVSKQKNGGTRP